MKLLNRIRIKGFKSVRDQILDLGRINVLIGANGAGKSNLISFIRMLGFMAAGELQLHIARSGGAETFLYYGSKNTRQLESTLAFDMNGRTDTHYMRLEHAVPDTLIFAGERISSSRKSHGTDLGSARKESGLSVSEVPACLEIRQMMSRIRCFQFHDTSETCRIRQNGYIEDNRSLRSDGGNLAAFLHILRETKPEYYSRIVSTVRQAAPHFGDFDLEPARSNPRYIMLNWKERGADYLFGPHQLPDGLLRFVALATLLLQPEDDLPAVTVIDEPELGLHPFAVNILGALIRKVSCHCQVVIATQSLNLLDQFEEQDIVVVQRRNSASELSRPDPNEMREWRKEYSLSEMWEKNIIGGRPSL